MKIRALGDGFALISLGFVLGCASASHKATSGLEQVTKNEKSFEEADKQLGKAQSELTDFQGTLRNLRGAFKQSGVSETQNPAIEALERLSLKMEQAQLDIKEIQTQNNTAARELDVRLKNVASDNHPTSESETK